MLPDRVLNSMRTAYALVHFISERTKNMGNAVFNSSLVKRAVLIFLVSFTMSGAAGYENEATFQVTCDESAMYVNISFSQPFGGIVFVKGNHFNPSCSSPAPNTNVSDMTFHIPFYGCDVKYRNVSDDITLVSSYIVIQQHRIIETIYDIEQNISCELAMPLDNLPTRSLQVLNETNTSEQVSTDVVSWLAMRAGIDLFDDESPDSNQQIGLFLVIYIGDGGFNKDIKIQTCIAHDEEYITNNTLLYQLYDAGCPNASGTLSSFTVTNETNGSGNMMAYAMVKDFALFVRGKLYVTCGVSLCGSACPKQCTNGQEGSCRLSVIVKKRFVRRKPGVSIPFTLQRLNTNDNETTDSSANSSTTTDPSDRIRFSKRSVSDSISGFLSSIAFNVLSPSLRKINDLKTLNSSHSSFPTTELNDTYELEIVTSDPANEATAVLPYALHNALAKFQKFSNVSYNSSLTISKEATCNGTSGTLHSGFKRRIYSRAFGILICALFVIIIAACTCFINISKKFESYQDIAYQPIL